MHGARPQVVRKKPLADEARRRGFCRQVVVDVELGECVDTLQHLATLHCKKNTETTPNSTFKGVTNGSLSPLLRDLHWTPLEGPSTKPFNLLFLGLSSWSSSTDTSGAECGHQHQVGGLHVGAPSELQRGRGRSNSSRTWRSCWWVKWSQSTRKK